MTATQPQLLIDDTLSGERTPAQARVNIVPASWLSGCALTPYISGELDSAGCALATSDAILLRSVTQVTAAHLSRSPRLRAVATLSSGTDHIDDRALRSREINLFTGLGGNAIAVADWVQWAVARLGAGQRATAKTAAVIGCGAVGSRVTERLLGLGWRVLTVDPPRARRDAGFSSWTLDDALAHKPQLVTLHVPLTETGEDATRNLLSAERMQRLAGATVLNAARGGVLDEQAAMILRRTERLSGLAIDTFCHEPEPDPAVIAACDLATPHIGGHSIEGKLRVAALPLRGLRAYFGLPDTIDLDHHIRVVRHNGPPSPRLHRDPFAALDASNNLLRGEPSDFKRHRAAHWRVELAEGGDGSHRG